MITIKKTNFGEVTKKKITEDVDCLVIKHDMCEAKVSLYGGQVLDWKPCDQDEVFWVSDSSEYKAGKAIRGGIPLCWPWFGPYKNGGNHGFVRNQLWQLEDVEISATDVTIILTWQGEDTHPLWPHKAKVTQVLSFGKSFKQTLKMENLSDNDTKYTGALHTYFSVSHPKNVTVNTLNNIPFDCKLTGEKQVMDDKSDMQGPMDRIYYSAANVEILDAQLNRKITISTKNTNQWVMWNPGKAVATGMSDMHENAQDEFFCLEAANTQRQVIPAYGCVAMSQSIDVQTIRE